MVEIAEGEPTIEEIVVALRAARQSMGRVPPFSVVDGRKAGDNSVAALRIGKETGVRDKGAVAAAQGVDGSTDIGDLQAGEIERLSAENARLNKRIVFLLNIIEREQSQKSDDGAEHVTTATGRSMISSDVRTAIEAEFRPLLLVLLRLLEKLRADQANLTEVDSAMLWPAAMPAPESIRAPEATIYRATPVKARAVGSSR
jgi:hypothetical protein